MSVRDWHLTPAAEAFKAEHRRLRAAPAQPRTPLLAVLGVLAARVLVAAPKARTAVLTVGGFGCLTAAAWTVAVPLGLAVAGVSLLVLEWLTSDSGARGRR